MDYKQAMEQYIEDRVRKYPNLWWATDELRKAYLEGARVGLEDARETARRVYA